MNKKVPQFPLWNIIYLCTQFAKHVLSVWESLSPEKVVPFTHLSKHVPVSSWTISWVAYMSVAEMLSNNQPPSIMIMIYKVVGTDNWWWRNVMVPQTWIAFFLCSVSIKVFISVSKLLGSKYLLAIVVFTSVRRRRNASAARRRRKRATTAPNKERTLTSIYLPSTCSFKTIYHLLCAQLVEGSIIPLAGTFLKWRP